MIHIGCFSCSGDEFPQHGFWGWLKTTLRFYEMLWMFSSNSKDNQIFNDFHLSTCPSQRQELLPRAAPQAVRGRWLKNETPNVFQCFQAASDTNCKTQRTHRLTSSTYGLRMHTQIGTFRDSKQTEIEKNSFNWSIYSMQSFSCWRARPFWSMPGPANSQILEVGVRTIPEMRGFRMRVVILYTSFLVQQR